MENHVNMYDIVAAREAMWRALTGTTRTGSTARPPNTSLTATDWEVRKAYWATVFRVLGNAVHLVQDMAQPQHTRNDFHSGYGCLPNAGCIVGRDSFYEKYTAARTLRATSFTLSEGFLNLNESAPVAITTSPLSVGNHVLPRFSSFADYFSTGSGDSANAAGRGLANYSNRGFYSAGTNVRNSLAFLGYPSPDPSGQTLAREFVVGTGMPGSPLVDISGKALTGKVIFLVGDVQDNLRGTPDRNIRLSTLGLWDQFLNPQLLMPRYTLTHYN
jgi:hypothetical protein